TRPSRAGRRNRCACAPPASPSACAWPRPRSAPRLRRIQAPIRVADHSSRRLLAQAADAERTVFRRIILLTRGVELRFFLDHRLVDEEVIAQVLIELRVAAAQPFKHHGRVLLLLVAVVREDRAELL